MARINIFCGHYGSGKSEIAVNYAVKLALSGKKVTVVDMDTVNPYFRSADAKDVFAKYGIELISSRFANTNLDIPALPQDIKKAFYQKDRYIVFDVGGDDDGAVALGQFFGFFSEEEYDMFLVANTKRPLTKTQDELYEIAKNIEAASRLKFTAIANNTNIGCDTDENTLFEGIEEIKKLSEKMNVPIRLMCGTELALSRIGSEYDNNKFLMQIYIKMPWEQ